MSGEHRKFERHCALLAADALTDAEAAELMQHAADCCMCREEIAAWERVAAEVLAAEKPERRGPVEPKGMRQRFVARAIREGVPLRAQQREEKPAEAWRHAAGFAIVALMAALIAGHHLAPRMGKAGGDAVVGKTEWQGEETKKGIEASASERDVVFKGSRLAVPQRVENAVRGRQALTMPRQRRELVAAKGQAGVKVAAPDLFAGNAFAGGDAGRIAAPSFRLSRRNVGVPPEFIGARFQAGGEQVLSPVATMNEQTGSGHRFHYDGTLARLSIAELRGSFEAYPPALRAVDYRFRRPPEHVGENTIQ